MYNIFVIKFCSLLTAVPDKRTILNTNIILQTQKTKTKFNISLFSSPKMYFLFFHQALNIKKLTVCLKQIQLIKSGKPCKVEQN